MHMTTAKPLPEAIRQARLDNPKMRERDLAAKMGISEAHYVAAHCGVSALRIEPRVDDLLKGLETLGEVMALTRNDSAVHEKIGVYEKVTVGRHSALVLGSDIDLRIFPKAWAHGFAVEKKDGDTIRRSLQFFDAAGDAVHKVHLRPASNLDAYAALVEALKSSDQQQSVRTEPAGDEVETGERLPLPHGDDLRQRWSQMTDVHQFVGILRDMKITRHQAVRMVGGDFAWAVDGGAVSAMMALAASEEIPIMCFVGNQGCIQIHSGPIHEIRTMGPWINVMDPTFHLHLRQDHIRELWAVRKPVKEGHVTSLEAYDEAGRMVIQFFGKRHEGTDERGDWRILVENLPRMPRFNAA